MDAKRNEIKVGIAVLLSLIILIGGVMWGKGFSLRQQRYIVEVVFTNVSGLERGANVLANGVIKGRVKDIILEEGKVRVVASLDKNVTLYSDYQITVESPTVMAGKALSINPGERLPPADITLPLVGQSPLGMTEAVATFQNVSADLRGVLRNLDTLLISLNQVAADSITRYNISNTLSEVNDLVHQSNRWMRNNSESMSSAVRELDATLAATREMVQSGNSTLNRTLTSADSAAQRLTALSSSMGVLVEKINAGEGSIGKMMGDDAFYERVSHLIAEVDSLARSIRTKGMKQRIVLF